jgi:putative methionine-R-sulfoxide reductase with GAF domain
VSPSTAGLAHVNRVQAVEEEIVSEAKKPIRDEQTLAKVLEAAHLLQEHNREMQKKEPGSKLMRDSLATNQLAAERRSSSSPGLEQPQQASATPKADSSFTLAQIVEIQHQVQVQHLELESVMSLIAERLTRIAGMSSAAIGILEGKKVHYRAAAGVMALPAGTEVPMEKALCVGCFRTGGVFRCADIHAESLVDGDECRRRGIQSMIAVPVFYDGGVAGSLELYFPNPRAFTEENVNACQLMAGLVSEALARNEKVSWKKSLATERAVMLEALEKLKPNLTLLADRPAAKDFAARASAASMAHSAPTFVCAKCGHELVGQEQFCGNCGLPRTSDYEAPNLQSAIAAVWHMQEALNKPAHARPTNGAVIREESQAKLDHVHAEQSVARSIEEHVAEPYAAAELLRDETIESAELPEAPLSLDLENSACVDLEIPPPTIPNVDAPETTALAKPERPAAWSSAATTRDFLTQLAAAKNPGAWALFWHTRRGDIYLAIAVILVLGVIRWGIWSSHSVSATGSPTVSAGHRRAAPDADLSLFDRILVKLGLAEAPDPPVYKGNPRTQVWVDLQTALYYCPGADLYGKTPKGKFSSQRDAQLDQFEPAYRKTCD